MAFEIEFFPVGEGSTAGDAIVLRYLALDSTYKIIVIDGGTDSSGSAIVEHIKTQFGSDSIVSDVISTHPDTDHSCGLRAVLKELPVERLWVHGLWHHANAVLELFSGNWTAAGLAAEIKSKYPVIAELIDLADENGTAVHEPFQGDAIGPFTVLSPSQSTYEHLIPQFRKTPAANVQLLKERGIWIDAPKGLFAVLLEKAATAIAELVPESWSAELLKDGGVTAAENESSTVLYGQFGASKVLLTADAGRNALWWSAKYASAQGLPLGQFSLIQVPHHGSRRNVSPDVLDLIVGPILPEGSGETQKAIASVPKDDTKHPRRIVINAFTRRGAGVRKTRGTKYRFHDSMPAREGEVRAVPLPFYNEVEDYD